VFVGHYGPSFFGKALRKPIPLWVLFIAVQWLDVVWSILVLLGIEKVRIAPGITKTSPLDLYYMPYTHSLPAAVLWSVAVGFVYFLVRRADGRAAAVIVGAAVFSHWLLDFVVHLPDLPIYDDTLKVGLGLWNYPAIALGLEMAFLFGGMYLYFAADASGKRSRRRGMVLFGFVMLAVQSLVFFGPPPASDHSVAITAILSYIVFAAVAGWLDARGSSPA
jgi:membrane-bound metal-dependent hydrolase YbcI (DUF457 family)